MAVAPGLFPAAILDNASAKVIGWCRVENVSAES